ncbi:ABC transporter permease, partial [Streptomyces spiralis]
AVVGCGLYLALLGLFALAVGAIIRHTAASITVVIGFVLVITPMAGLLPGSVGEHVHAWLPTQAGFMITQQHSRAGDVLGPWQGLGVLALWTAVLLAVAAVQLRRRDA